MEQEIGERIKLSAPDAPLKLYQRLKQNALLGKDMDVNAFLADLGDLDQTGAIRRQPLLQQTLQMVGQDPLLKNAVLVRLGESYLAGNKKELENNHRLTEILGIKVSAPHPPKRRLKTKALLAAGAGLVAAASVVGSGAPAFLPPAKAKESKSGTTEQISPPESTPTQPPASPTARVFFPNVQTSLAKVTSTAIPAPKLINTPRPTETPTPTTIPKPTSPSKIESQKIEVPKKDILREIIAKRLYHRISQLREQRNRQDPEYAKRVDLEFNNNKINGVFLGLGKENALTDSIQVFSYDIPPHALTLVSIPRDLISPEVFRATGNIGSARINQALAVGGDTLAIRTLENATALSMDLVVVGGFETLIELIDKAFGTIEVHLDKPIKDPYYPAMQGTGYDPFYIEAGTHRVDGLTASKIARSRMTTSDYDRSKRQQLIMSAIISKFFQDGPIEAIKRLNTTREIIEKRSKNGTLKMNFDIASLLIDFAGEIKNSAPAMFWDQLKGMGWKIGDKPPVNTLVVSNQNLVVSAGISGVAETKIKEGNPYSLFFREHYWNPLREMIHQSLADAAKKSPYRELSTRAQEAQKVTGGLIQEVIVPKLLPEVDKIRQQKSERDPGWAERVDHELNKGRINILLIGTGSEIAWQEENIDAAIVASYSAKNNKIGVFSLHRDVWAPEISRLKSGKHELMTALRYGGIPLTAEIAENTTGLSMDYYVKLRPEAVAEFVNRVFGKLKITVPQYIPLDEYGTSFEEGEQEMDGRRLLQYMQTRTSSSMERRNSAQQQVMETMMDELFRRLETQNPIQNIQMLTQIQGVISDLVKEGKLETNLNLGVIIEAMKNEWPQVAARLIGSKITGGQFLGKPSVSKLVVRDYEMIGRTTEDAGPRGALRAYFDPETKEPIVDVDMAHLVQKYYQLPRSEIKKLLTGKP